MQDSRYRSLIMTSAKRAMAAKIGIINPSKAYGANETRVANPVLAKPHNPFLISSVERTHTKSVMCGSNPQVSRIFEAAKENAPPQHFEKVMMLR